MEVKITMKRGWQDSLLTGMNKGLLEMVLDIDKRSAVLAPKDTRALVNDRKVSVLGRLAYQLKYGSGRTPYARRRHFENKKNPQTKGYLSKAAESVTRGDTSRYFRGKI